MRRVVKRDDTAQRRAAVPDRPAPMTLRIIQPVWLHTHKAMRGDVVTVDVELGAYMIKTKTAERYVDDL